MSKDNTPENYAMHEERSTPSQSEHHPAPNQQDPDQQLSMLKQQLEQDRTEIGALSKHAESLQSDITDLEKIKGDIEQALTAYGQALPEMKKKDKDIDLYFDTKMKMILAAIGDNKEKIKEKIKRFDERISTKKKRLKELDNRKAEARQEYEAAQKDLEEKQRAFDNWKAYQQKIQQNLADMQKLKVSIEEADDKSEPASMYFLATEMERIKEQTKLVSQDELKGELHRTWDRLSAAKSDVRDKKSEWESAVAEYDNEEKELQELKGKRREKILEAIREYNQANGPYRQHTGA